MTFDDMLLDPASAFDAPQQVLADGQLSREQKVQVLRRWEDDARLLLTAQSEGMKSGDSGGDVLARVQSALESLNAPATDT
ncbi:MAG: hypothetical protein CMQ34_15385 [Gammaproteobacteria bacterium]|nr:hypothetical protein [Gammaproteobacteria bacterium]MBC55210.1 hypothetical protein [Gammaproteobacteria bacterium]|tara:strand:- start:87 stop:329 length:243 start_codon:yes stop_codon:yes gene_type:complete